MRITVPQSPVLQTISPTGVGLESRNGRFLPTGGQTQTDFQVPSSLGPCKSMPSILSSLIKCNYFDIKATLKITIFNCFKKKPIFPFQSTSFRLKWLHNKKLTVQYQCSKRHKRNAIALAFMRKSPQQCQGRRVLNTEVTHHCVTGASVSSSVTAELLTCCTHT